MRRGRRLTRRALALAAVALVAFAAWRGPVPRSRPPAARPVAAPRSSAAERAIADRRRLPRSEAVAALDAAAADGAAAPGERAEAAFRAAELVRAVGRLDDALRRFADASALDPDGAFDARGRLESAHVHRRAGRDERAIAGYLELASAADARARERHEARYWAARLLADAGRALEARALFERAARDDDDPRRRARAFDAWARSYLDAGDLEAAAGVLAECSRALAPLGAERTGRGERARRALDRMSSPAALARAVRARFAAGSPSADPSRER